MISRNVWRVQLREYGYLGDDVFDLIFRILDIDDFDRDRLTGPLVDTKDRETRPLCDFGDMWSLPFVYLPEASTS